MLKKFMYVASILGAAVLLLYAVLPPRVTVIDTTKLRQADAIWAIHGNGARIVYVFESADCSFCREMQPDLEKLPNATIFTFVLPGHTTDSKNTAKGVWCAPSRSLAWSAAMRGESLLPADCPSDPSQRNLALAKTLNLAATPAIINSKGEVTIGLVSAQQLEQLVSR